jgi:VanZ family protein
MKTVARLLRWCAAAGWCAFIFYLSSLSKPPVPGFFDRIPNGDKLGHFLLYGVLGLLTYFAQWGEKNPAVRARAWLFTILWSALYGASDEFHQHFTPGRATDIFDWAADVLGATSAVVFIRAAGLRFPRDKTTGHSPAGPAA